MLKIAKTEFYKLKRYSVVWIGVATMLTVVLLTRFMATASDGAVHTLEYFSNSVIWNNFSLIFPANRIAQKTLEIAYIAALCVFMVLFSMLLIVICIVYSLSDCTVRKLEKDGCL